MICCEAEDLLVDFADLSIEQRSRLEAHLLQCGSCQVFRDALQDVDSILAMVLSAKPARPLNLNISGSRPAERPSIIPGLLDVSGMFGVIACAAVLFATFVASLEPDIPLTLWFGLLLFLSGLGAVLWFSRNSASSNW